MSRNPIARDLRTPKYRSQVVESKRPQRAPEIDEENEDVSELRSLLMPATQTVHVIEMPPIRRTCCYKCPYGKNLTPSEQVKADALKADLTDGPQRIWGCHESLAVGKPQICAGWAKARYGADFMKRLAKRKPNL